MKRWLLFFLVVFVQALGQEKKGLDPTKPLEKDPYFTPKKGISNNNPQGEKIHLIHADEVRKIQNKFDGNTFLAGHVHVEHQGSVLKADTIIIYEKENFVKARSNVDLVTTDGNHLTSSELEYDGNTQKAVARKNVVLRDPTQTLRTETLYYDKNTNTAYFNTGGTIDDGKNIVKSQTGTYYVNERKTVLDGSYNIDNKDYIVDGKDVNYFRDQQISIFNGPTTVTNRENPSNRVYTEKGKYVMATKEVYLQKNSKIFYKGKVLTGDDMYYNQLSGFGKAKGNVKLNDPKENRYLLGGYGEIYEKRDSAMITEKPLSVKILKKDSLFFSAKKIISYQKADASGIKKSFLQGYTQARVFKSDMQGRADSLVYAETDRLLEFKRKPIVWAGFKQITGNVVKAYMTDKNDALDSLKVIGNAYAISKADSLNLKDEFNQVKGKWMTVYFNEGEVKQAKVVGNAQSITYADDQNEKTKINERIGVNLSTCGEIIADFEERKMQIISCNIGADAELYPMSKIPKEKRFFPDFNWNTKDRLRRWQDVYLDTPNYPSTAYTSDNLLYEKAEEKRKKEEAKNKPKETIRKKK